MLYKVVPHKRDVGLNELKEMDSAKLKVVPRKRNVGLNDVSKHTLQRYECRSSQEGRGFEYKLQNHVADWLKVVPRKRNVALNVNDIENLK